MYGIGSILANQYITTTAMKKKNVNKPVTLCKLCSVRVPYARLWPIICRQKISADSS